MKQTILGPGDTIKLKLAKYLTHHTTGLRLVWRKSKKANQDVELFPADLIIREEVSQNY